MNLTDINFFGLSEKGDISKISVIFHRNCKPWDGCTVLPGQLLLEPGNPKDEHAARGTAARPEARFLARPKPGPFSNGRHGQARFPGEAI